MSFLLKENLFRFININYFGCFSSSELTLDGFPCTDILFTNERTKKRTSERNENNPMNERTFVVRWHLYVRCWLSITFFPNGIQSREKYCCIQCVSSKLMCAGIIIIFICSMEKADRNIIQRNVCWYECILGCFDIDIYWRWWWCTSLWTLFDSQWMVFNICGRFWYRCIQCGILYVLSKLMTFMHLRELDDLCIERALSSLNILDWLFRRHSGEKSLRAQNWTFIEYFNR